MSHKDGGLPETLCADLVLYNGNVLTVDPENSVTQAVAIRGNRILMVGDDEEVKGTAGSKTEVVDLGGRAVLPGLMDIHLHMMGGGLSSLREFRIPGTSIEDVKAVIGERASETPEGEWLIGGNVRFAHVKFAERRFPTRHDLDEAAPNHLVFIHLGPHIKVVNTRVLELAGITESTPDPLGGTIVKDPESGGSPTASSGRRRPTSRPSSGPPSRTRTASRRSGSRGGGASRRGRRRSTRS